MKKQPTINEEIAIYQSTAGALELKTKITQETIWLTQDQIALLFDVQKAAISKHIKNIFESDELEYKATVSKMETVRKEGARKVKRSLEYYNLDLVLSVGYRVNSKKATHFRQWATRTLRDYIVKDYAINPHQIKANYQQFLKAIDDIKSMLPTGKIVNNESMLDLVILFSETWLSLDTYDKDELQIKGITKKRFLLKAQKLSCALLEFKNFLVKKGEPTEIFGKEISKQSIVGIVGNIMQSFDGHDLYPSIQVLKRKQLTFFI